MRRITARAYGPTRGRSIVARLTLENADPANKVVVGKQVGFWVEAVWDKLVPEEILRDAWKLAFKTVAMSTRPQAAVAGGAGAFWAALRRIGWTAPTIDTIRINDGTVLYFGQGNPPNGTEPVDPRALKKYIADDWEVAELSRSTLARDLADVAGRRGYARCKDAADGTQAMQEGGRAAFVETEQEGRKVDVWRRAKFMTSEVGPIPWLSPGLYRG